MNSIWFTLVAGVVGYLFGSIPSGYIMGQRQGIDIRQYGSKNIGATNVLRTLGPAQAAVVFAMDVLKGVIPVAAALLLGGNLWVQIAAGVGALAGHTWPITLRFKGGRAVATSFGVFAVLSPWAALCALAIFVLVVGATRYVSLGSMTASAGAAVFLFVFQAPVPIIVFGVAVAVLIIYRHRPNIQRLRAGTEAKIGQRVAVPAPDKPERKAR